MAWTYSCIFRWGDGVGWGDALGDVDLHYVMALTALTHNSLQCCSTVTTGPSKCTPCTWKHRSQSLWSMQMLHSNATQPLLGQHSLEAVATVYLAMHSKCQSPACGMAYQTHPNPAVHGCLQLSCRQPKASSWAKPTTNTSLLATHSTCFRRFPGLTTAAVRCHTLLDFSQP
jgi:hypothetical protein